MKKSLLLLGLVVGFGLQNVKALNGNDQVNEELKRGSEQKINGAWVSHEGVMSNPTNMSKQPIVTHPRVAQTPKEKEEAKNAEQKQQKKKQSMTQALQLVWEKQE